LIARRYLHSSKLSAVPVWLFKKGTHLYGIATGVLGFIHGAVTQTHQVLLGLGVKGKDCDANAR
jgi:hypothetical protein